MRQLEIDPISEVTSLSNFAIMKLLCWSLGQCYFSWDSDLYCQISGLPMGGRLSPILANIFMEDLEHKVLSTAISIPRLFFHYVDDVILVWNTENGSYEDFLLLLNECHPDINLTDELEKEDSLAFLDIRITRPAFSLDLSACRPLQISIYRKETHSNRYLHFNSAHPFNLKRNIVKALWLQANRLLKNFPRELHRELHYLRFALNHTNNDYLLYVLDRWFRQFSAELKEHPEKLLVQSRLTFEE
ncbi:MAG: hypothetical protein GY861_27855, partial [bacterium]|nr:hypothetical protein [bacterium]